MINKNLMFGGSSVMTPSSAEPEEAEQRAAPLPEGDVVDSLVEGEFDYPMPEWNDPFDCLPPSDPPQLSEEEEEEVRRIQQEEGTEVPPIDENTEFEAVIEPVKEVTDNTVMIIDGIKKVLKTAIEESASGEEAKQKQKRVYKNKAKFEKAKFAKPKESQPSMKPKLIILSTAVIGISSYFGVEASSYYMRHHNDDATLTPMKSAFAWLMDMPEMYFPIHWETFFTTFLLIAFIAAVAVFFMWDSSEGKKRRREGKEHGDGRLATPTDFKKFKGRFMD